MLSFLSFFATICVVKMVKGPFKGIPYSRSQTPKLTLHGMYLIFGLPMMIWMNS